MTNSTEMGTADEPATAPEPVTGATGRSGPNYPISSVDNALRLLLLFRDQPRIRLSDAAQALGVANSTAHRLLAMLVRYELATQDEGTRAYEVGPALLDLGFDAVRKFDIREIAKPILFEFAAKVEETTHIAQLDGTRIRYLMSAECSRPLRVVDRSGQIFPAHDTATGRAILAHLTSDTVISMYNARSEHDKQAPMLSPSELTALLEELRLVRERSYATNYRPEEDITSLATVIRDSAGHPVASINASGPRERMGNERQMFIIRHLHAAAARIEELLPTAH